MKKPKIIEAIDLFCGAGGLSYGLKKAGVRILAGIDIDPACAHAFKANNEADFIEASIDTISGKDLAKRYSKGSIRLLAGCAPCQPFSTFSNGRDTTTDAKWGLLYQFGRIASELKPDLITMENVPKLKNQKVFKDFVEGLTAEGYLVEVKIVFCPVYGIPQNRRRLVLIASKLGSISLIRDTHGPKEFVTVKDTIGALVPLKAGETSAKDSLHKARSLIPINLKRIKKSVPGGTWRDWPEDLRAACHQRAEGASFQSVYSRMEWDAPSPTITTQSYNFGTGRFGHPTQDRAITLREAALLQTFPKNYEFLPKGELVSFSTIGRLIGNAVPPRLGEVVGISFMDHLRSLR